MVLFDLFFTSRGLFTQPLAAFGGLDALISRRECLSVREGASRLR